MLFAFFLDECAYELLLLEFLRDHLNGRLGLEDLDREVVEQVRKLLD